MKILFTLILVACAINLNAQLQCGFVRANSTTAQDSATFTLSGGSFESYGCSGMDPTYWVAGNGPAMTITFIDVQENPSLRVWGMNDDDVASVTVNGSPYTLNSSTASYAPKVLCGQPSPGPDGVVFANGNLVGANDNFEGNYSYQDVTLNATNVNTITITSISGAGWGFIGVKVCDVKTGVDEQTAGAFSLNIYPNPTNAIATLQFTTAVKNASLAMYNALGQLVYSASQITGTNYVINSANLPAGIYTVAVLQDGQKLASKRLVVAK